MRPRSFLSAVLAIAGILSPMGAKAAYIEFTAAPFGAGGEVNVGANLVSGAGIPLSSMTAYDANGAINPVSGTTFSGATLSFTTGTLASTNATNGNMTFNPGGAVAIADGSKILFSGQLSGTTELMKQPGELRILATGVMGTVNSALDTAYGLTPGANSQGIMSLNLTGTGPALSLSGGTITIDPNSQGVPIGATVPEPASLVLVALGLPVALLARRRALKASL